VRTENFNLPQVTAIIPAYNEELTIGSVVISTAEFVDQIIVVDDGSTDHTSEIAEKAGAEVIKHSQNQGKGTALKTGFSAIKKADIIITIDGDGQHNPYEIPLLVKPIADGQADLVNGSRYMDKKLKGTPVYRRIGQTVLDKTSNINSGLKITDTQSGFRAFAVYTIPTFKFSKSGFSIESEMLMDAASNNFKIMEVQVGVSYNKGKKGSDHTKNPIMHGVGVFVRLLQDMEFRRPLYYFCIPGLVLIGIGLVMGLVFFGQYLDGQMTTLMPTIMAGMIGLGGIFVTFTGVILHSVSRMIEQGMGK
jgi:glycosyltransferase involved in cell wall biosynthesis